MKKEEKTCLNCTKEFTPKRSDAKYCSTECRTAYNNKLKQKRNSVRAAKRLSDKSSKFDKSTFAAYLIQECKRAGTVQILEGIDLESLKQLRDLAAKRSLYNGGDSKEYAISHIYPVTNRRSKNIGLLCPANLVITPAVFNRKRQNKLPVKEGAGKSIPIHSLRRKFNVDRSAPKDEVLGKIKAVIGPLTYNAFLREYGSKLNLTTINQVRKKLDKVGVCYSASASLDELKELYEETFMKHLKIGYSRPPLPLEYVVREEVGRLSPWSPFKMFIDFYTCDELWFSHFSLIKQDRPEEVKAFVLEQAIKHLHGDNYCLEFDGRPLIEYFSLRGKVNLLQQNSDFVNWLHVENRYEAGGESRESYEFEPF